MPNIQTTPRGVWAAKKLHLGTTNLTADSTGLVVGGTTAAIPGSIDNGNAIAFIKNSTGFCLAINVTSTTWAYLSTTSVQPS
jgi:hypothetical protein